MKRILSSRIHQFIIAALAIAAISLPWISLRPAVAATPTPMTLRIDPIPEFQAADSTIELAKSNGNIEIETTDLASGITYTTASADGNGLIYPENIHWSCVGYAPNGTCIPHRADLYTWSSGIYPFAPRPRMTLNTTNPVAINTQALLEGTTTCQRPGMQTISLAEIRNGVAIPIGSTITNNAFTIPWQVTGPTGVKTIRATAQGPCGIRTQIFSINVTEMMIFQL